MKILRNTPDQLILENKPVWLAVCVTGFGLLFAGIGAVTVPADRGTGILFIVAGLFVAFVFNMIFVRRSLLILDRSRNLVDLRRRSWFGDKTWTWELRYLDRAVIEGGYSKDTNTQRAALVIAGGMDAGTHPITLVFSSGPGAQRAADAINGWLDSAPPTA